MPIDLDQFEVVSMRAEIAALKAKVAAAEDLVGAATFAENRMTWWLDADECECDESGHRCGRLERTGERDELRNTIAAAHAAGLGNTKKSAQGLAAELGTPLPTKAEQQRAIGLETGKRIAEEPEGEA